MADNEKRSRADNLFDLLNDFSDNHPENNLDAEISSSEPENTEESISQEVQNFEEETPVADEIALEEDVLESKSEEDIAMDEILSILNAKKAQSEESPEDLEDELSELPASIFDHLSNENECEIAKTAEPSALSHFTETDGAPVADPEEEEEEEEIIPISETKVFQVARFFKGMTFIPKVIIYVLIIAIVSSYLSYYVVTIGNDVFALVTDTGEVTVTIEEGMTHEDVGRLLKREGIIEYPKVFELYMQYRGDGDSSNEYIVGTHVLKKEYNYSQIITLLTTEIVEREIVRVTIPEGYTVNQIIDLLVEKGVGQREDYVRAINDYPYKWDFVMQLDELLAADRELCKTDITHASKATISDRLYRLEGYLYPDTYEFYTTEDEVYVINKMLAAFNEKFWKDFTYINDAGQSYQNTMLEKYGLNFDEVITLASMAQSEGGNAEDYYYISYVFHNRLKVASGKPLHKLQSDATIQYIFEERLDSSEIDTSINSPYNSYRYEGLPPGAISNPGMDALSAAMFPAKPPNPKDPENESKNLDAYFFVSNKAGKTYFAETESGHLKNCDQVEQDNKAIEDGTYEG